MALAVRVVRVTPSGRREVICTRCDHALWLTRREIAAWSECPHCVGWWTFRG